MKSRFLSGKMQADQMVHRLLKEAGAGNGCYSNILDHPFAEFQICKPTKHGQVKKFLNIRQNEIRSLGNIML